MSDAADPETFFTMPARRVVRTLKTRFEGKRFHVTVGFARPVPGVPKIALECFINGSGKVGSERDLLCDDAAVLISLLLRLGMRPRALRRHLGCDPADPSRPLSIVAAAVSAVIALDDEYQTEQRAAMAREAAE